MPQPRYPVRDLIRGEDGGMSPASYARDHSQTIDTPDQSRHFSSGILDHQHTPSNSSEAYWQVDQPSLGREQGLAPGRDNNNSTYDLVNVPDSWSHFDIAGGIHVGAQFTHTESGANSAEALALREEEPEIPMHMASPSFQCAGRSSSISGIVPSGTVLPLSSNIASHEAAGNYDQFHAGGSWDLSESPLRTESKKLSENPQLAQPNHESNLGGMSSMVGQLATEVHATQQHNEAQGPTVSTSWEHLASRAEYCSSIMENRISTLQTEVATLRRALQRREATLERIQRQAHESHRVLSLLLWERQDSAQHP